VSFVTTLLVSDDATAHPAPVTDPVLVNPWGMSSSPAGPFAVSDNGSGKVTLYSIDPGTQATTKQSLTITLQGNGSVTGQVVSGHAGSFNGDLTLFVSQDGAVSGWRSALGTTAELFVTPSPTNVYTGAAFGSLSGNDYLYAANFYSGHIDVFKGTSGIPDLTSRFDDPVLPSGYAPFNIQNLGGVMYVTYAPQDTTHRNPLEGAGLGIVDRFDLQGTFLGRVATGGSLDDPWGVAIAPSSFGALTGSLIVGNAGDGSISAFGANDLFLRRIVGANGQPLTIDGLRALSVGTGGSSGSSASLYFTAGPQGGVHGVFGVLTPIPEPSAAALLPAAVALMTARALRARSVLRS